MESALFTSMLLFILIFFDPCQYSTQTTLVAKAAGSMDWVLGGNGRSCTHVCQLRKLQCSDSDLASLNTGNVWTHFETALGKACSSRRSNCQSGRNCESWGAPYIHENHVSNPECQFGTSPRVAPCGKVPVDRHHRRLCPCKASSGSACELEKNVAISPSGDCGDGTNTFGCQKCTTKSHGFSTTDFGSVINAKSASLEVTKAECKHTFIIKEVEFLRKGKRVADAVSKITSSAKSNTGTTFLTDGNYGTSYSFKCSDLPLTLTFEMPGREVDAFRIATDWHTKRPHAGLLRIKGTCAATTAAPTTTTKPKPGRSMNTADNNQTIAIALGTVVGATAFLCFCIIMVICVCIKSRAKRKAPPTQTVVSGPSIRRTSTPVATAVSIPTENSIANLPVTTATVIHRTVTVDAAMVLPPTSMEDMDLPVAVAATI